MGEPMTKPTPADLIRAAEIEEALAEWCLKNRTFNAASYEPVTRLMEISRDRAAALRAMASQHPPQE